MRKCKHCGERIIRVNGGFGPYWTHQPSGATFLDQTHKYCHKTLAEPGHQEGGRK